MRGGTYMRHAGTDHSSAYSIRTILNILGFVSGNLKLDPLLAVAGIETAVVANLAWQMRQALDENTPCR